MMILPGVIPLEGDRWTPFLTAVYFEGIDLTDATFRMHIRLLPDTPGSPLVDLETVVSSAAQGVRFIGYGPQDALDGKDGSAVTIRINESTMEDLPEASEIGKDSVLHWDLHVTRSGLKQRWLAGTFTVRAGVTQ